MTPKYPIKAFDGTTTSDIQVLNVPAGAIDPNGEIDLGQGIKVYRALLTQSGTDAPTATVLENTLGGTLVWTRDGAGTYLGTLAGAFATGTVTPINLAAKWALDAINAVSGVTISSNVYRLQTYLAADLTTADDGVMTDTLIEFSIYP